MGSVRKIDTGFDRIFDYKKFLIIKSEYIYLAHICVLRNK